MASTHTASPESPSPLSVARRLTLTVTLAAIVLLSGCALGETTSSSGVTSTSATLTGVIGSNLGGTSYGGTTYWFEYGPNGGYGSETPRRKMVLGDQTGHEVHEAIGGLQPGTTYTFRVCAMDADQDRPLCLDPKSFTTASASAHTVTVVEGTGSGNVRSTPAGIDCMNGTGDCSERYAAGTRVTLHATPASGYRLKSWAGGCTSAGGAADCTLTVDSDIGLSADFTATEPACADPMTDPDPTPLWKSIQAASPDRHQWFSSGGPGDAPFRRMTVRDGDDFSGERAELGKNDWHDTFCLFHEGDHRIISEWIRLPADFPFPRDNGWQICTQFKQAQPSVAGGGVPRLELGCEFGNWAIDSDLGTPWSTFARVGEWTHLVWDVHWSQSASLGSIQLTVTDSAGVRASPVIHQPTLKPEVAPCDQGIACGASIPGHMRIGLYHDPSIPGTHVDLAGISVTTP